MHHRHLPTIAVLSVVAVAIMVWLVAGPSIANGARRLLESNDLVAMLREVDRTNTAIVGANDRILQSLEGVKQQAGAVAGVHGRLTRLEQGLGQQQQTMAQLESLTAEQVTISHTLRDVTAGVEPLTAQLAGTAGAQAAALERMSGLVGRQAGAMAAILQSNGSIAQKLRRAEVLSATVLTRMP